MSEKKCGIMKLCAEVLQDAAFLFTDDWDYEKKVFNTINIFVRIDFTGYKKGFFVIGTTGNISNIITENMLGIDGDDPIIKEKKYDALKEVANILCGHILTFLFGENCNFNILEPYLITKKDFDIYEENLFYKFLVEGEPFVFFINQ